MRKSLFIKYDTRGLFLLPKALFQYSFISASPCDISIVKVARVVKLKLASMEWFFYNQVILIKLYKIRYLNLDKALLFPSKPGYLSEKFNTLTRSNYHKV